MKRSGAITEADILKEIVAPESGGFSPEAANSILNLRFSRRATGRIRFLLRANNRASLAPNERVELEKYLRVGQLLDLLHAKAKLTLATAKAALRINSPERVEHRRLLNW